jgi:hypothetical protein
MKELIKDLENKLKEYQNLVKGMEESVISFDYEDSETYGVFVGKAEMLEYVIEKLKTI